MWRGMALGCVLASAAACDSKSDPSPSQVALSGRVFSADTAGPVDKATVEAPGGKKTTTAKNGQFAMLFDSDKKGDIAVTAEGAAPVKKRAPDAKQGYVELSVKSFDALEEIDPKKTSTIATTNGASIELPAGKLQKDGKQAERAKVGLAQPDPRKKNELSALPGDFDCKQGKKQGKLSAESPLYVAVWDGEEPLTLEKGAKAKVVVPTNEKMKEKAGTTPKLYRFDEELGIWVEAGPVTRGTDDAGEPYYSCQIDRFGWFAVGEFYDQLTCVRGCVEDPKGERVAGARVIVTGVDHFSELTTYSGNDGCFGLDVRAGAEVSVVAQIADGLAGPKAVDTSAEARSFADDLKACQSLGTLALAAPRTCTDERVSCGNACVDLRSDLENCGSCGALCEGSCLQGDCVTSSFDAGPSARPDASVDGVPDAGPVEPVEPDSGPASCSCAPFGASDGTLLDGCCVGQSCGYEAADLPFTVEAEGTCALKQPVTPIKGCPNGVLGDLQFEGCCLGDGQCGVSSRVLRGQQRQYVDYGLGCLSYAAVGLDMPALSCGSACGVCEPETTSASVGELTGCCAGSACGSTPNALLLGLDFPDQCVARDQPGVVDSMCPDYGTETGSGYLSVNGCCRADNTCGYDTTAASVNLSEDLEDLGLGCAAYAEVGDTDSTQRGCGTCGTCEAWTFSFDSADGCCLGSQCGSVSSYLMLDYGFIDACIPRNQLGRAASSTECNGTSLFSSSNPQQSIYLDGCCRSDNTCGYSTSSVFFPSDDFSSDMGLGCVTYGQAGDTATPIGATCTYIGQQPLEGSVAQ